MSVTKRVFYIEVKNKLLNFYEYRSIVLLFPKSIFLTSTTTHVMDNYQQRGE